MRMFLLLSLFFLPAGTLAQERPNIVLVMCDDLGWGDVGFNGGQTIQTPHLDEMARHGLRFSRFYAQSPVCSPTRGSCMTGRHPYRYGIPTANSGHMKTGELTLAELLQDLGYTTGHFGKWHLGTLTQTIKDANRGGQPKFAKHFSPPQVNGFDVCFSTESKVPTYDPMLKPKQKAGSAWDSLTDLTQATTYGTYYWNEQGKRVQENLRGDDSRIIMDRAVPFIQKAAQQNRPFFTVIWFHTPHLPLVAGPEHRALYPNAKSTLERNYYGAVTAMDEQIGRLRRTLRELHLSDNTLITFCSDNGPEGDRSAPGSAGPYRGRKRSLYEGGIRVPGIIEWPKVVPADTSTEFASVTSDYLPTILDYLSIECPDQRPIDGVSLRKVFSNPSIKRENPIGFRYRNQIALSGDRFKLIRDLKQDTWELYDLLADPSEKSDIADQHPQVVAQMSRKLENWMASCDQSNEGADYPSHD